MAEEQSLSPEDAAPEAQQQCIFCHIATGKVAARKVYEDDKVTCVLDINPANPGHVLIVPKQHYVIMPQIPEDVLQHIGMVAKGVSHAQLRALKAQGTNVFVANGVTAGQRAQHFMMHVIPRMDGDQIGFAMPEKTMNAADAKKAQQILKKALGKAMGLKVPDEPESHEEEQVPHEEKNAAEKKPAKEETETEEEPEPEKAPAKKEEPKKGKSANLDDIARLLGGA